MRRPHRSLNRLRPGRRERGSSSLELVVLAPGFLLTVAALIFGGRVAIAGQSVHQAAAEASRTASIARTQQQARETAVSAAAATLHQQGLDCTSMTVTVTTSGFNAPVGTPAAVTATVTCPVRLADLAIPGIPGTRTVTATVRSPIDSYRERS